MSASGNRRIDENDLRDWQYHLDNKEKDLKEKENYLFIREKQLRNWESSLANMSHNCHKEKEEISKMIASSGPYNRHVRGRGRSRGRGNNESYSRKSNQWQNQRDYRNNRNQRDYRNNGDQRDYSGDQREYSEDQQRYEPSTDVVKEDLYVFQEEKVTSDAREEGEIEMESEQQGKYDSRRQSWVDIVEESS